MMRFWGMTWLMGSVALALAMPCQYSGGKFSVNYRGQAFSKTVYKDYAEAVLQCGQDLAALYDGDEWVVFSGADRRFYEHNVANGYAVAQLELSATGAVLYDGSSFHVFFAGEFANEPVAPSYRFTKLAVSEVSAALYDGKSVHGYHRQGRQFFTHKSLERNQHVRIEPSANLVAVYDGRDFLVVTANGFALEFARPGFIFPVFSFGSSGVLLYDGRSVLGYCPDEDLFARAAAEKDRFAQALLESGSGRPLLKIAERQFGLYAGRCSVKLK